MGDVQIGHRPVVFASEVEGAVTVRMGRCDMLEMGGLKVAESWRIIDGFSGVGLSLADFAECLLGRPEVVGGGSSRPSFARRESWRAKSELCHHSRNLSAKIEVGSRIFRLERRRG